LWENYLKDIHKLQKNYITKNLEESWFDGYVGTVGEGMNVNIIRNYIKNQRRKGEQLKLINFV